MIKKIFGVFICMLLVVTVLPVSAHMDTKEMTVGNDGTLSGYVNDTSMNPIQGARVRVLFHGTFEEDYTDSSGYYHVTNIPICYCMKNCVASKIGYKREQVLLAIVEDTTHDFILSTSDILFVGGSGPDNYTKIQDAIDDSKDGNTVFVFDDSSPYYENLVIDKSINLIGENKDNTIIDGEGKEEIAMIVLKEDGITVQGFTIKNGSHHNGTGWGVGIKVLSDFAVIRDNIVTQNSAGIYLGEIQQRYANNSIIQENIITKNREFGIYVHFSYDNIITENIITSNKYHGIFLCWETGNNLVTSNNVSLHEQIGIWISSTDENTIQHNSIRDNREGVIISSSCKNKVIENNIYNNKINAMVNGETFGLFLDKWLYNTFDGNYWGRAMFFPKVIFAGCILILPNFIWTLIFQLPPLFIPTVVFDLHPASEPFDI